MRCPSLSHFEAVLAFNSRSWSPVPILIWMDFGFTGFGPSFGLLQLLLLFVKVFAVFNQFGDGWFGLGIDLHQVHSASFSHGKCLFQGEYSDTFTFSVNDTKFGGAYLLVDSFLQDSYSKMMNLHNTKKQPKVNQIRFKLPIRKTRLFRFGKTLAKPWPSCCVVFGKNMACLKVTNWTYAGRLDPMAEGIVPILVGDARFQKDHLLSAVKTYEVEVLLGLSTDTGDMLGLPTANPALNELKDNSARKFLAEDEIKKALDKVSELKELPYPNYSSRPVEGKPLFMHARAGNKVTIPIKKITIHTMELLDIKELSICALLGNAQKIIAKVQGDFRQEEIMEQWIK